MYLSYNMGQVNALVQSYIVPQVKEQVFGAHAFFMRQKGKTKPFPGGRDIIQPLAWRQESGGGGWWSGVDTLDTTARDPLTVARWTPKNAYASLVILREEELQVKGPTQVKNLFSTKSELVTLTMRRLLNGDLYNDGSNAKAIGGLQHALKAFTGAAPGVLPSNTYGGITRQGRYDGSGGGTQANNWWIHYGDNTAFDAGAAAGATSFNPVVPGAVMNVLGKPWAQIAINSGGKHPTMLLSNWGAWTCYHNALSLNDRYMRPQQNTDLAKAGFENLMYKNSVWVADDQAPRSSAKVEQLYFINEDAVRLYVDEELDFTWDPFRKPHNQQLRVGYLLWRGELCIVEPRACGVLSSIDCSSVS